MKIYYGKTNQADLDNFGTDGLVSDGWDYFSGCVEFGTNPGGLEDVVIIDGCGRSIPLSVDQLPAITQALLECYAIKQELDTAQSLHDEAMSDMTAVSTNDGISY